MKCPASVYKGIEFVSVQDLPAEQQFLLQTEDKIERIKILIDDKIVSNCIQYKHYSAWYTECYESLKPGTVPQRTVTFVPSSLALNKI